MACAAPWTPLEAQLLDCRIALRSGATSRAQLALEHGVALAGAMAVFRPLVMAPATVGALLAESLGHFGDGDELVRDILALRAARVHVPPTIPLTERDGCANCSDPTVPLARLDRRGPVRLDQTVRPCFARSRKLGVTRVLTRSRSLGLAGSSRLRSDPRLPSDAAARFRPHHR